MQLFPAISPYKTEMFDVSDGHQLYLEQTGNPDGIPILFLHGGPGAGISATYRQFFDPEHYRIIGFDQRGCGKSLPFGSLEHNTSQLLVQDVLAIQSHLKIGKWVLFGGSWGSTLALLVAIEQPQNIIGLILRGIFLAREEDYSWYLDKKGGAAQLFPEFYNEFLKPIKSQLTGQSIADAYYDIFTSNNEVRKMAAIKAWFLWEARISRLHIQINEEQLIPDVHRAISLALLECHYIKHQCFIPLNHILNNTAKIKDLPINIIHGRYDTVCKVESAYSLHQALDNSKLSIIPEAGHSAGEKNTTKALCRATRDMLKFCKEQS
ncbi:prolyl aminopeptidase [uncultured Paraglaciecola sp.]|uniref:prolyl aminopeptidase n=1 Tax=uncultured Paraglaciecola sp. TaxID=1765024 RepID=UPI00259A968C|nr:prolyl aminopeptidase [uncultured Paraglaciecola sp.]